MTIKKLKKFILLACLILAVLVIWKGSSGKHDTSDGGNKVSVSGTGAESGKVNKATSGNSDKVSDGDTADGETADGNLGGTVGDPVEPVKPIETQPTPSPTPTPTAPSVPDYCPCILYRVSDGKVYYSQHLDDTISIASTTKLLTASVMLRYLSPDNMVTVGWEVELAKPESSMSNLTPGTELSVRDLLAALLIPSGNDAAYTVAVNTARAAANDYGMSDEAAVDYFVGLMNDFAAELGMYDSHFANPEGWDDPDHYSTLNDMLILCRYVLNVPVIINVVSSYNWECLSVSGDYYEWINTNYFLHSDGEFYRSDCIGLKTGSTDAAGNCFIGAYDIGGEIYICAVMGCDTSWERFYYTNNILEYYL